MCVDNDITITIDYTGRLGHVQVVINVFPGVLFHSVPRPAPKRLYTRRYGIKTLEIWKTQLFRQPQKYAYPPVNTNCKLNE